MTKLSFIFVATLFTVELSHAELIRVADHDFDASQVEYFVGSTEAASFAIPGEIEVPFARGQRIKIAQYVYLHRQNQGISATFSQSNADLPWVTKNGTQLDLNCSSHPASMELPARPRVMSFHPGMEYKTGCQQRVPLNVQAPTGTNLDVIAEIDINSQGEVEYARNVVQGRVPMGDQQVELVPSTGVAFYPGYRTRFATPQKGAKFTSTQGALGQMQFEQTRDMSFSFFPGGEVERGVSSEAVTIPQFNLQFPKGSGLVFNTPGEIGVVLSSATHVVEASGLKLKYSKVAFDYARGIFEIQSAEPFSFIPPGKLNALDLPMGALVAIQGDTIIGIRVPRTQ